MHAPVRPIRGRWPAPLERVKPLQRFFRLDPLVILDDAADPAGFREAMTSIYVGGTIKITGAKRHPETDQLLLDHVDLQGADIVDIGASDGSTSLDLIALLPALGSYTIADLYLRLRAVEVGSHTLLFTDDDTCVLVVGRRAIAWPAESGAVAVLYRRLVRAASAHLSEAREVVLLNPEVRRLMTTDPRITAQVHDIFEPWPGAAPDVIKVANLLRRLYFSDEDLLRALRVLRDSLPEEGHLMIVDNPRIPDTPPRAGIWARRGQDLTEVARIGEPEIADLVARVGAP
jgi:hypothetical protein